MGIKISDMAADSAITGIEKIPVSDDGAPKSVTVDQIKAYVIDAIEAVTAGTTIAGTDKLFVLESAAIKPLLASTVAAYVAGVLWGKAAETVVDAADVLPLKDGGTTEKTVTAEILATYIRSTITAANFDVTGLTDAGTLGDSDVYLVSQDGTGKKTTLADIRAAVLGGIDAYLGALSAATSANLTDVLYATQGGTEKRVTLAQMKTAINPVIAPATSTEESIPQWDSASLTLKDGLTLQSTVRVAATAVHTALPTEKAVRTAMESGMINGHADIGGAVEGTDTFLVDDGAVGTQRKSAVSRLWDYVVVCVQALAAKTAPVAADFVMIQDSEASNAPKGLTLANLKLHMEAVGTYGTVWIPAKMMTPSATAGCAALASVEYGTNDLTHAVLAFPGITANSSAEFSIVMPSSWDRSAIKFRAYWSATGDANADEWIKLSLCAGAFSNDDALDAVLGTAADVADQLIADDDLHVSNASAALTVGGTPALHDVVHFKLTRDYDYTGGGTAMDVDVRLVGVLIQYKTTNTVAAW